MEMTIRTVKTWTEKYYSDESNGMLYYRPKRTEHLSEREHACTMVEYMHDGEPYFTATLQDESGGPIISGRTAEECESKFKEAYLLMLFVSALDRFSLRSGGPGINKLLGGDGV